MRYRSSFYFGDNDSNAVTSDAKLGAELQSTSQTRTPVSTGSFGDFWGLSLECQRCDELSCGHQWVQTMGAVLTSVVFKRLPFSSAGTAHCTVNTGGRNTNKSHGKERGAAQSGHERRLP